MQANIEMDEGRRRLAVILEGFPPESPHWNEAQNRFQFVDRLLLECLGWEQPYIEVEKKDDAGGKSDYLLGKPARAALEAKREAKTFALLPSGRPSAVRKLRPLIEACSNLKAACEQVVTYCAFQGAQLAAVCNGPQLVIFHAMIPGSSPFDGEAFVFNGFDAYLNNFPLLWRLLSPEGVYENIAYREIAQHRNPRIPAKASTALSEPTAYRYRTSFQENLRILASVLSDDIEDNPAVKSDFYRECYVSLDANNRHLMLSKNIIAARYKRVSDDGVAPAKLTAVVRDGKVEVDDAVLGPASAKPVVVIGDVGVGKTSFFENLYEQLETSEKAKTCYVHINLGDKATLSRSVKDHVLHAIPQVLRSTYGIDILAADFVESLYKSDLVSFDTSSDGSLRDDNPAEYRLQKAAFLRRKTSVEDEHLKASLTHLVKSFGWQMIVVIDNADQRNFETQQEAFLVSQELASTRSVLVFVALRPATFYQSKLSGALSGYQNRVLTISPPPADEVVRKRLTFALRIAEGKTAPAALEGVRLNLQSIASFLTATLRSVRSNAEIRTFLSNITGGNTRMVIELITSFCGSPNVECERIVRIEEETHDYKVPLHEFTKHALLGEYAYYNPISSFVACNIFDVTTPDPREHFLCSIVISFLLSGLGVRDNDGFVVGPAILTECRRLGFTDEQTRSALQRLATRRLIETPHGHYREIKVADAEHPDQFSFRATSIGAYHARTWSGAFSFIDATSIDTPIFDESVRSIVFSKANSMEIRDRFAKASSFRDYLETSWHRAAIEVNYLDFSAVIATQKESFLSVQRFLEGGKNRKQGARQKNARRPLGTFGKN